jgi:hypothetical protein
MSRLVSDGNAARVSCMGSYGWSTLPPGRMFRHRRAWGKRAQLLDMEAFERRRFP